MFEKIAAFSVLLCSSFVLVPCQKLHLHNGGAGLVIYPQNVFLNAVTGKPLDLLCVGDTEDEDSLTEFKWLNPRRDEIREGSSGVERVNSNTLLLTFVNPTVKDSGNYKCTAIYAESDYLEAEVSVLFYENIEFKNCSEYQLLFESEDGVITCHVGSSNESLITWTKDSKKLESSRYTFISSGIAIENVKTEDAGLYTIEVFEPRTGALKSGNIDVDVSDRDAKDVIGIDKLFVSEVTESTLKFDIRLSGEVWGIEAEYREKLSDKEESVLWTQGDVFEVRNLIPSGRYRFRFRPRPSKTTKWLNYLDVTLLPEAPKVIYNYRNNGNLELKYVWTTDDSRRGTIDKYRLSYLKVQKAPDGFKRSQCIINVDISPCFGSKYTITGLSNATIYEINVTAHTSAGFGKSASQTFEVGSSSTSNSRVEHPVLLPLLLAFPIKTYEAKLVTSPPTKRFYVPIHKPFEVTCKGEPTEDREFTDMNWINPNGKYVTDGHPSVLKPEENALKLLFADPTSDDNGVYQCIAKYRNNYDLKTEVTVYFFGSTPTFETEYEEIVVEEGSEVKVTCFALGDKPLNYTWFDQHEQVIRDDMNSSKFTSESEDGSTLTILTVEPEDEMQYVCTARNDHGLASKIYQLKVIPSSNNDTRNETAIRNIRILNVTSDSVQFGITTSNQVSSIEVMYKESKETSEYQKEWKRGDVYIVRSLIPAGRYDFKFRAISSTDMEGGSTWSKTYTVVLLPGVPEVIFRNLEGNSFKIEWFRNFDDILRGTIDKYQLKYYIVQQERGRIWKASDCAVTIELPTCIGSGYTVAGLSRVVYYELEVRAHTETGYGNPYKQKIYVP